MRVRLQLHVLGVWAWCVVVVEAPICLPRGDAERGLLLVLVLERSEVPVDFRQGFEVFKSGKNFFLFASVLEFFDRLCAWCLVFSDEHRLLLCIVVFTRFLLSRSVCSRLFCLGLTLLLVSFRSFLFDGLVSWLDLVVSFTRSS